MWKKWHLSWVWREKQVFNRYKNRNVAKQRELGRLSKACLFKCLSMRRME